jgi:hypothetical protein
MNYKQKNKKNQRIQQITEQTLIVGADIAKKTHYARVAMAMYIPLFTACYSRYQEADGAAPYIITLDEAFAGVDENNIREMFEIVEHLGFNYMMNSQVLWGDYDTISRLAICELVRPKNADFVSVIHYNWDGKKLAVSDFEMDDADSKESTVLRINFNH